MMSEELGNLLQVCSDVHLERGDLQKKIFSKHDTTGIGNISVSR